MSIESKKDLDPSRRMSIIHTDGARGINLATDRI